LGRARIRAVAAVEPSPREILRVAARACTDRQLRALVLLEQGLRYRRVAESMGITSATAYEHVEAGMRTVYRNLHA
jgi:DNA-binding CsgD family transcriptional regulator